MRTDQVSGEVFPRRAQATVTLWSRQSTTGLTGRISFGMVCTVQWESVVAYVDATECLLPWFEFLYLP